MVAMYKQIPGCDKAEPNACTKEVWCTLMNEFCQYIKTCPVGYVKEASDE